VFGAQGDLMIKVDLHIPKEQIHYDRKLGTGGFGVVYKATWFKADVAVKQLLITLSGSGMEDFEKEIKIHANLRNPHIVQIFGVLAEPRGIVMEYMSRGSLRSVLENNLRTEFSWERRKNIAADICAGLFFLHQQKVIHRDLKSLNVLLDESYRAKLADFGLAKVKSEITTCLSTRTGSGIMGTPQWMAPEIFMSTNPDYNTKTDVYSFGVVLWELASHEYPYKNANPFAIPMLVVQGLRETFPSDTPQAYARLATLCWDKAPDVRPTVDQAISCLKAMDFGSSYEKITSLPTETTTNSNSYNYLQDMQQVLSSSFFSQPSSYAYPFRILSSTEPLLQMPSIKSIDPVLIQEINVLKGHIGWVYDLIQLTDGTLASGSSDNTIRLWDLKTRRYTKIIEHPEGNHAKALIQLRDGNLASVCFKAIKLWNPQTGNCLKTFQEISAEISYLIQLSDGNLASSSADNIIRLWDSQTGKCFKTLQGGSGTLAQLTDGTLASGSAEQQIKLWDLKTEKCLKAFKGNPYFWYLTQLSDGNLACGSGDDIKILDLKTGGCLKTLKGSSSTISRLIQLSDGTLASASGNEIKLWDLKTEKYVNTLKGHTKNVRTLIQLSDGTLASGSEDGTIKIWG
jgi:serine/threonine protein kinase